MSELFQILSLFNLREREEGKKSFSSRFSILSFSSIRIEKFLPHSNLSISFFPIFFFFLSLISNSMVIPQSGVTIAVTFLSPSSPRHHRRHFHSSNNCIFDLTRIFSISFVPLFFSPAQV